MDAIQCLKTRRSVRKFKPDKIPRKTLMEILDCARHAPSSMNSQPWQFIVVTSEKQKQELSKLKPRPSPWIVEAPAVIGVCVELMRSRSHWIEDGAVAAQNILLAAHALGLGACWITMRFEDTALNARIQKALGLDANTFPICLIALGYPDEEPNPRELRDLQSMVR